MVHTDPNAAGRFYHYYNMHPEDRRQMSLRRNPSYDARFRSFAPRSILVERGLDLSAIDNARAVQIAEERGWQGYILNPDSYDPALVLEFYAAMVPPSFEEFSTVFVQGRPIRMTNDDICNFYGAPRHPDLDATFGIPPIDGVAQDETHSPIIASSLRRNNQGWWRVREAEIKKSEMEPELGLWLLFVKGSLAPSSHYTTLNPYVARIMYCIQHSMPLDIGHIIRLHMIDAAAGSCTGVLPFPCLITQFCRNAGIATGRTIPAFAPYNQSAYRQQVTACRKAHRQETYGNERMNVPEEVDEVDAEDADYDPVQEEGHQPTGFDPRLHTRLDRMETTMQAGFERMNRGFRALGVNFDEEEAGPSNPPQARRVTRQQTGANASRRRRNRE